MISDFLGPQPWKGGTQEPGVKPLAGGASVCEPLNRIKLKIHYRPIRAVSAWDWGCGMDSRKMGRE